MEQFRIRILHAAARAWTIERIRELTALGQAEAEQLIDTRGVILDGVRAAEARRILDRRTQHLMTFVVERTSRHVLAYDPLEPARADQTVQRLRVGPSELEIGHGQLGALEPGPVETFANDDAALQAAVADQLASWTASGLALADSEIAVVEAVSAREPGLEAALREDPSSVEAHLIYGDWLESRGDPRGQLIALQHAVSAASGAEAEALAEREQSFRTEHVGHLWGPLRPLAETLVERWSLGFIDAAHIGLIGFKPALTGPFEVLDALLRLPIAARLTSLWLSTELLHHEALEELLLGSPVVAGLRTLLLGDGWTSSFPALARLWPRMPRLDRLGVGIVLRPPWSALRSSTLTVLELHVVTLEDDPDPRERAWLPALRTLVLYLYPAPDRFTIAQLSALLSRPDFDGVDRLVLGGRARIDGDLARMLAAIPRVSALERLDLSPFRGDDAVRQFLIDARERGQLPANTRLPRPIA